jgi:hypothetical protein
LTSGRALPDCPESLVGQVEIQGRRFPGQHAFEGSCFGGPRDGYPVQVTLAHLNGKEHRLKADPRYRLEAREDWYVWVFDPEA